MPSRRRFLACAATAASVSLLRLPPAFALDDDEDSDEEAAWTRKGLVTRADWDADESLRTWTPRFTPVQVITVHHSARPVGGDAAGEVRAIYDLHARRLGWGDVGYHLLIDPDGTLYEGRHAGGRRRRDGDDDEDEDGYVAVFGVRADEDARPPVVTGGHVRGHNPGNVGVCLLGDFTGHGPTGDALETLEETLAGLCRASGLDPLGTVRYTNPDTGAARTARTITAHRDWKPTACPGAKVIAELEEIRKRVAELLH